MIDPNKLNPSLNQSHPKDAAGFFFNVFHKRIYQKLLFGYNEYSQNKLLNNKSKTKKREQK
jgi:hypothetical protein